MCFRWSEKRGRGIDGSEKNEKVKGELPLPHLIIEPKKNYHYKFTYM
jgi:hypothetical protein